jgi:hypothetical protein
MSHSKKSTRILGCWADVRPPNTPKFGLLLNNLVNVTLSNYNVLCLLRQSVAGLRPKYSMDFRMPIANNVTRLLDSRKISYTAFELPAEKLGALETARLLDVEPAAVYKTIVVAREKPKNHCWSSSPAPTRWILKHWLLSWVRKKCIFQPNEKPRL